MAAKIQIKAKGIEEQLRQAVLSAEMSRRTLAGIAGLDTAQLSYFVRGRRTLTLRSAVGIAQVLGLELVSKKK